MQELISVRQRMRAQREALSSQQRQAAAAIVAQKLLNLSVVQTAEHIAVYLAHQGELELGPTITALWQQGKRLYLPCLSGSTALHFHAYTATSDLQANRFGILEVKEAIGLGPRVREDDEDVPLSLPAEALDIVLVPLVAFDALGHRLGMGQGYYDRCFAFRRLGVQATPCLIGCAYPFQEIPVFEPAAHDVAMDLVVY